MKNIIVLMSLLILTSCSNNEDRENVKYFEFNEADDSLIIKYDYTVNQIITYENQIGEQLHFKVILNERKRHGYYFRGTLSGGGGGLSHYYDGKIIRFEILENRDYERYGLVNYIYSKNNNTFNSGINFPMWNVFSSVFIDEVQNPTNIFMTKYNNMQRTQMNINGHLFQNIVILDSRSNEIHFNFSAGVIPKNVNKIYYDYDFGIVQFNDIDGKKWKLIYPE